MPSPSDKVQLLIAGEVHEDWESYEIDSDLLVPSDAWSVSLGLHDGKMPADAKPAAGVEVRVGGDTVMVGKIDEATLTVDKRAHTLALSGRDGAAVLIDCSAPIFVKRKATLGEIVSALTKKLAPFKIRIDAENARVREKVNVEPGDTAWDALAHAAEANGLWPWFAPDGTLVVGGPDYTTPVVAHLVMRATGQGNNIERLVRSENVHERYSEVTVYGQTHGTDTEPGKHNLHDGWKDSSVSWYRPKVVVDHESDSTAVCRDRARKLLMDSRLKSFTLTATVKGHRIVAPGLPGDGKLWTPGQRIQLFSEPHGVDGVFFLMGRKFRGGRSDGATTELTLKEDGIWTLDAHPHKRKHRRGKNEVAPVKYTYDNTGPAK